MTNQEINERVAILCGWFYCDGWNKEGVTFGTNPPNYAESLDACQEFEQSIALQSDMSPVVYVSTLALISGDI